MPHPATLFVVDDDASCRDAAGVLARSMGLEAAVYPSLDAFLADCRDEPGCLIADLRLALHDGALLPEKLRRRGVALPVVLLAARPSTAAVVQAMRAGAFTVVEKPWDDPQVEQAVREALAVDAQRRDAARQQTEWQQRLAALTDKEQQVLRMLMAGKANKTMANHLGASLRTIENRRRSIFTKLGVRTVAELVAAVLKTEDDSPEQPRRHEGAKGFTKKED
jgi:FixJ family two-component response regulator